MSPDYIDELKWKYLGINKIIAKDLLKEARKLNQRKSINTAQRTAILELANYKCMYCGFDTVIDIHHIVPYSKSKDNSIGNLAVLCPNHHKMIHLEKYREEIIDAINKCKSHQKK